MCFWSWEIRGAETGCVDKRDTEEECNNGISDINFGQVLKTGYRMGCVPLSFLICAFPPPSTSLFCLNRIWLVLDKFLYLFIIFCFLFYFSWFCPTSPFFFNVCVWFFASVVIVVNPVTRKAANSNVLNSLTLIQACQVLEWLIRLCAVLVFL